RDSDKPRAAGIAKQLIDLGFKILATEGTFKVISDAGLECERVNKVTEGRPNIVERIKNGEIHLVINTTEGKKAQEDSFSILRSALPAQVYNILPLDVADAVCQAIAIDLPMDVYRLQGLTSG